MSAIVRATLNLWRRDAIIVVGVTVITVLTDLAIAMLAGVVHVVIEFRTAQVGIALI